MVSYTYATAYENSWEVSSTTETCVKGFLKPSLFRNQTLQHCHILFTPTVLVNGQSTRSVKHNSEVEVFLFVEYGASSLDDCCPYVSRQCSGLIFNSLLDIWPLKIRSPNSRNVENQWLRDTVPYSRRREILKSLLGNGLCFVSEGGKECRETQSVVPVSKRPEKTICNDWYFMFFTSVIVALNLLGKFSAYRIAGKQFLLMCDSAFQIVLSTC